MHSQQNPYEFTAGSNKVQQDSERVPQTCPNCERKFSKVLCPSRRLQTKAKLILAIGFCLSLAVVALLALVASATGYVVLGGIVLVVVAAPAYGVGLLAMKLPRVVTIQCRECNWSGRYLVDKAGHVVPEQ